MPEFKPWQVCHLDLRAGVPDLTVDEEHAATWVVIWWGEVPLGQLLLYPEDRPLPAGHLRERVIEAIAPAVGDRLFSSGFRGTLPDRRPPPDPPPPLADLLDAEAMLEALDRQQEGHQLASPVPVSVIVCTRDRPEALRACLQALKRLRPRPSEVLVVDNAPRTSATRAVVEQVGGATYWLEPRPGLSAARNAGIAQSSCPILAFTDDDVEVHPAWAGRLAQALAHPNVMAATGLVLPAELATEPQVQFQQGHSAFGWGFRALTYDADYFARMRRWAVPVWHIGAGANMAFRRGVFDRLGGFDERLGAGAAGCSEDSEMWYRVLAAGWACRYEPDAVVYHHHRREAAAFQEQMFQYMRGHVAALLIQHERHGHRGNLRRLALSLPSYYARWAAHRVGGGRGGPHHLGAQVRGCLAGLSYYLRHRHDTSPPRPTPQPARQ